MRWCVGVCAGCVEGVEKKHDARPFRDGSVGEAEGISKQARQMQTGMGYSAPWLQPTYCDGMDKASGRAQGHPEGVIREKMEGIERPVREATKRRALAFKWSKIKMPVWPFTTRNACVQSLRMGKDSKTRHE